MLRKIVIKYAGAIIAIAKIFGLVSASTGCRFFGYQPHEPEDLMKQLK